MPKIYYIAQHYTEMHINNQKYFVFILLPGIKEFIPEAIELLAKY